VGKHFLISLRPLFPTIRVAQHLVQIRNLGQSSLCFPYFPTFIAEPECRESLRLAFSISLHLVLNLNVGKVFALPSLFPYI